MDRYNEMIKQIKLDILEMDVKDREFITDLKVEKSYEHNRETTTVHITYCKDEGPEHGMRKFKKPEPKPQMRIVNTSVSPLTVPFTYTTGINTTGTFQ